jgi:nicotinamide mononucleotide transporter
MSFLESLLVGIRNTGWLEWLAAGLAVVYVVAIMYKKRVAWLFAGVSSMLYAYLCYSVNLYLEMILQVFYFAMAVFGWLSWHKAAKTVNFRVSTWPVNYHVRIVTICLFGAGMLGYVFDTYSAQENPYTDALTTVFSFAATFMVTKKLAENWLYWIAIDALSTYLYLSRDLFVTAILFAFYAILAYFGWRKWKRELKTMYT